MLDDAIKTWKILNHEKETEIRLLNPTDNYVAHYFISNEEQLRVLFENRNGKHNMYIGVNERSHSGKKSQDVTRVTTIVLDIDSAKPPGFKKEAATQQEVDACFEGVKKISDYFVERGFIKPKIAFTGNGYSLWAAIPPIIITDENRKTIHEKIKLFHKSIQNRFEYDKRISIDQVGDLARIMRFIGTKNIKGSDTSERPRRDSKWIDEPIRHEDEKLKQYILSLEPPKKAKMRTGYIPIKDDDEKKRRIDLLFEMPRYKKLMEGDLTKRDGTSFKSRSEAEFVLVREMIELKLPKDLIWDLMSESKIGKWAEATEAYKEYTYKKALEYTRKFYNDKPQKSGADFII